MFDTRKPFREGDPFPPDEYTYRDPLLSLWQSAANFVVSNTPTAFLAQSDAQPRGLAERLMSPVHAVRRQAKKMSASAMHLFTETADFSGLAGSCAKLTGEFLWAEVTHQKDRADLLASEIKKSVCDGPGWAECLEQYLLYKAKRGQNPYRSGKNIVRTLPDSVRIGIIGDWGTGEFPAIRLLAALNSCRVDMLIHLGDIYYAGTETEVKHNFLQICRGILGPKCPLYSLCGNHDMYSGGGAYYSLLDEIGQEASYFCLRNSAWQLLAMDTGNHDQSPLTVSTNMTSLNETEIGWHIEKFRSAENRKTILLSHHQLFSPFAAVGQADDKQRLAYNPNLYSVFQGFFPQVEWWFWGHEHTLAVYDLYMGLKRGRCVGASAIPVFVNQQSYLTDTSLITQQPGVFPAWNPHAQLGNNGTDYNHAFAVLELSGQNAAVNYYEVDLNTGNCQLLTGE